MAGRKVSAAADEQNQTYTLYTARWWQSQPPFTAEPEAEAAITPKLRGKSMKTMKLTPTLRWDEERGRYSLSLPSGTHDWSSELLIGFDADGCTYHFVRWIDGDWFECLTREQFDQRVADICENEGAESAAIWRSEQEQALVLSKHDTVWKLHAHWEAMLALGLFEPAPTLRRWEGKPVSAELARKMDEARTREMQSCD